MPELEVEDLNDFAVLLEAGNYNRYGRVLVSDVPIEVPCRWVENVTSTGGNQTNTSAIMAQVMVDRYVGLSSILWHGRLVDFPRDWATDPVANWLTEVADVHGTPDIEGRNTRWSVDVTRFRGELPEQQ